MTEIIDYDIITRTSRGRLSRKKTTYDWSTIIDAIYAGDTVEVQRPPHLTIYQTRDKILSIASVRGMVIDYRIVCGHLDVWRLPAWKCLKLGLKHDSAVAHSESNGAKVNTFSEIGFETKRYTRCRKCGLVQFIIEERMEHLCLRCKNPLVI